jgi:hypothetical protein
MKYFLLCLALFGAQAAWAQLPPDSARPADAAQTRQPSPELDSLFMTPAQNGRWVAALHQQARAVQWARIRRRYLVPQQACSPTPHVSSLPLLVVAGVLVELTSAGEPIRDVLATELTAATVKAITVLERITTGCHPDAGALIVSLADKPLRKRLHRMPQRVQQPDRCPRR